MAYFFASSTVEISFAKPQNRREIATEPYSKCYNALIGEAILAKEEKKCGGECGQSDQAHTQRLANM
jgi:hypothetical protein